MTHPLVCHSDGLTSGLHPHDWHLRASQDCLGDSPPSLSTLMDSLVASILLAGLSELVRTAQVTHPLVCHSDGLPGGLHPHDWPLRASQSCPGDFPPSLSTLMASLVASILMTGLLELVRTA